MRAYELARRVDGEYLQVLELLFELTGGDELQPVNLEAEAAARLGMEKEALGRAIMYWSPKGCLEAYSLGHVRILQPGVDRIFEISRAIAREQTSKSPLLWIEEVQEGETNQGVKAMLAGSGQYESVRKAIGVRQLFFLYHIFLSKHSAEVEGAIRTVVSEDDLVRELLRWGARGYKRIGDVNPENARGRLQQEWGEFVRQINKVPKLVGLFHVVLVQGTGKQRYYGIALGHTEVMARIWNLDRLFEGASGEGD